MTDPRAQADPRVVRAAGTGMSAREPVGSRPGARGGGQVCPEINLAGYT